MPFELRNAKENVSPSGVLELLDAAEYYKKLKFALPKNNKKILSDFINEKFMRKNDAGNYDITNFGALVVSKDFNNYERLSHKSVRVIWYRGKSKVNTIRGKIY